MDNISEQGQKLKNLSEYNAFLVTGVCALFYFLGVKADGPEVLAYTGFLFIVLVGTSVLTKTVCSIQNIKNAYFLTVYKICAVGFALLGAVLIVLLILGPEKIAK